MSYVSLLVTIKHHLEEGSIGITREGVRLEETLKERSPRAMLERACRPLAVLGRRASALAFPSRTETRVFVWVSWGRDRQVAHTKHQAPLKGVVTILQVLDRRQLKLTKHRIEDGDSFGVFSRHTGGVKLDNRAMSNERNSAGEVSY